jgi:hypothetical protein
MENEFDDVMRKRSDADLIKIPLTITNRRHWKQQKKSLNVVVYPKNK